MNATIALWMTGPCHGNKRKAAKLCCSSQHDHSELPQALPCPIVVSSWHAHEAAFRVPSPPARRLICPAVVGQHLRPSQPDTRRGLDLSRARITLENVGTSAAALSLSALLPLFWRGLCNAAPSCLGCQAPAATLVCIRANPRPSARFEATAAPSEGLRRDVRRGKAEGRGQGRREDSGSKKLAAPRSLWPAR